MNKVSYNQKIIDKANSLGFQKVGFAEALFYDEDKDSLYSWLDKNYHGQMKWIEKRKEERANVLEYFPEAKTIISFGYNYFTGRGSKSLSDEYKFSNYAWGDDYHIVIKKYLYEIVSYMKEILGEFNYRVCVDTSPLMEKKWAVRSGLGWIGKNTSLITKDYGSWLFLSEIIIDKKVESSEPFLKDLCGSCTACLDNCPTNALVEPYVLDSKKCISYLTIEHRGEIPDDYQKKLDNWIYGCDICQEVCPWNIRFEEETQDIKFFARDEIKGKNKIEDWDIDRNDFKRIFKKSAVKRTKYEGLKRNISLLKE
ncbi:MAG: tRNA epoxyqueuosine(34) reductase QueG [Candidatus Marinimicrobia bacterium]|nr:tRNA epoxyqueuosine(34) reductase QueG [Candidatus Neomarinimicrobiota bacterium]